MIMGYFVAHALQLLVKTELMNKGAVAPPKLLPATLVASKSYWICLIDQSWVSQLWWCLARLISRINKYNGTATGVC